MSNQKFMNKKHYYYGFFWVIGTRLCSFIVHNLLISTNSVLVYSKHTVQLNGLAPRFIFYPFLFKLAVKVRFDYWFESLSSLTWIGSKYFKYYLLWHQNLTSLPAIFVALLDKEDHHLQLLKRHKDFSKTSLKENMIHQIRDQYYWQRVSFSNSKFIIKTFILRLYQTTNKKRIKNSIPSAGSLSNLLISHFLLPKRNG